MITGRKIGRGAWSLLCGGSLLALNALGCNSNVPVATNPPGSMMSPNATQPSAGVGTTAPAASGSTAQSSANAGSISAAAGNTPTTAGAGVSNTTAGASAASTTAGASGGVAAGGGAATGSSAGAAAGSGGSSAGASGAGAAGGAGTGTVVKHEDLGEGDGRDVVMLGDSWMSNTLQIEGTGGGISPSLQRASGQPYRNYAVQGVMLLSADAFGPAIPTQWDSAKRADKDIKTVVMTGGGNDVIQNPGLQSDCEMNGDMCKAFRMQVLDALDKLWTQMASDGVRDIIYVRYAAKAGSNMMMDMSMMATVPVCTTGKVSCHALDTTALVMDELAGDGIHPLVTANDRMAKAIVDMMMKEGMRR